MFYLYHVLLDLFTTGVSHFHFSFLYVLSRFLLLLSSDSIPAFYLWGFGYAIFLFFCLIEKERKSW